MKTKSPSVCVPKGFLQNAFESRALSRSQSNCGLLGERAGTATATTSGGVSEHDSWVDKVDEVYGVDEVDKVDKTKSPSMCVPKGFLL
jgi:hypothetical protein